MNKPPRLINLTPPSPSATATPAATATNAVTATVTVTATDTTATATAAVLTRALVASPAVFHPRLPSPYPAASFFQAFFSAVLWFPFYGDLSQTGT